MSQGLNWLIGLRRLLKGAFTVYMGISFEIEVATIVTDEAMMLKIKVQEDQIAFSIKLDNVGHAMKAKKPAKKKKCCKFDNFFISVVGMVALSSLVA